MEGGFQPGTVLLEKYRLESVLGRGGMGVVLRVTHLHLGEELAIKILLPEAGGGPEVHARFLREAQSAVRLRGEHVARVGDVGVLPGGAPYMVMEYLRGGDLSSELARRGALPSGEVVDHVLQACEALAEAHALGIVHRDIKPSNLFLTRRPDGSPLVKVLDFGISKAPVDGQGVLTRTDTVMGTPGYMSPEQMKASKDVDARADIWALGIVLYECLNGRRPFDAETFSATVLRAANEPPPPMDPRIARGLQAVILRCLEKDRAARFPSIAALVAALAVFARDGRAAEIVAERTTAMLKHPSIAVAQAPFRAQSPTATTLSASTGTVRVRSMPGRYAIGGVVAALGMLVALFEVSTGSASGPDGSAGSGSVTSTAALFVSGESHMGQASGRLAEDQRDAAPVGSALVVTTDPAALPADGADQALTQKAAMCAELDVNQKWQELIDCASGLASLGSQDKIVRHRAVELRAKAVKEAAGALAAGQVQAALREGNLPEAQKLLRGIPSDSMSFSAALKAFRAAEAQAIDDNRHKAQVLVAAHDCAALRRFQAKTNATSTMSVSGAVAALVAKCLDTAPSPMNAQSGSGSSPSDQSRGAGCASMNIDEIMTHAANQSKAGLPRTALELTNKVLSCRQNEYIYQMAVIYACAARDVPSAERYYRKLSKDLQIYALQRCQQENVNLF